MTLGLTPSARQWPLFYKHLVRNADGSVNYLLPVLPVEDPYPGDHYAFLNFLRGSHTLEAAPSCRAMVQHCVLVCQYPAQPAAAEQLQGSSPPSRPAFEGGGGGGGGGRGAGLPLSHPRAAGGLWFESARRSAPLHSSWGSAPNVTASWRCPQGHVTFDFLPCDGEEQSGTAL